uniref:CSON005846 protein n=1 Tax=Culicoides sonorensis TaxID=179676 RepID=A0A336LW18_CULSO
MQVNEITFMTIIICIGCMSTTTLSDNRNNKSKDSDSENIWNVNQQPKSDDNFSSSSNKINSKPKFSDFHDLKLNEMHDKHDSLNGSESNKAHSRQKRLIWVTDDGRLALPPGTSLTITPSLALPFVRYPPDGFFSNISVSLPVTLDFDKLGLTDNQNPLGVLPPLFARQMGRAAGSLLGDYISQFLKSRANRRAKRDLFNQNPTSDYFHVEYNEIDDDEPLPKLPESHQHAFHGGERALLYAVLEDFLHTFGLDGKACLLRTICEIHSKSITHFGLFGEMLKLFLTASQSPYSHLLDDYVRAEKVGRGEIAPAECFPYYKECPKSLFKSAMHKYRKRKEDDEPQQKMNSM